MTAEAFLQMCKEKGFVLQLKEHWAVAIPPRYAVLQICVAEDFQGLRWQKGITHEKLTKQSLEVMEQTFEAWPHTKTGTPAVLQQKLRDAQKAE